MSGRSKTLRWTVRAVELTDQLFAIDAQAREEILDHAERHLLRQKKVHLYSPDTQSHPGNEQNGVASQ